MRLNGREHKMCIDKINCTDLEIGKKKGANLWISVFNMKHTVQKLYPLLAFQQSHLPYFYKNQCWWTYHFLIHRLFTIICDYFCKWVLCWGRGYEDQVFYSRILYNVQTEVICMKACCTCSSCMEKHDVAQSSSLTTSMFQGGSVCWGA